MNIKQCNCCNLRVLVEKQNHLCWLGIIVLVDNDVMVSMYMYSLLEQQVQESNSNKSTLVFEFSLYEAEW